MRALFLIYLILGPFGAQPRITTSLENHHRVKVGSGYGRAAHLPPPSPASSPPSKEVSRVSPTRTDEKTSENSELLATTIIGQEAKNQLSSFKKLFVSYLLPVSYVWNFVSSSDEKYWRPRPRFPSPPKSSDHKRQIVMDSNFHDHNNNKYGREGGRLAPPAPEYDPPIHQVTRKAGGRGLSSPF
ncbi:hypothetical protein HAX54_024084 [Datura stramonium]|uniref:Uncharacterized protein n=1 Tax=Datura stramonium TaxID=4076 RepID=A0ABS8UZF9_DATST|nr:hypothetical protein [Datura stramonium]